MKLQCCPCCKGRAYFADILVGDLRMWQVTCELCGLSTEYDDDRVFCRDRWNLRQEKNSLTVWVTGLGVLSPLLAAVFFLLGNLVGVGIWK
ncbi:MAG: hypothetical protein QS721_01765 [Candidatus Endonucleobacter sp. (ex Gigantidas childressi)]|nr:hypothetical protein [Candidatus Endonucleobacter sp. (ex Gigantidas childressi)]